VVPQRGDLLGALSPTTSELVIEAMQAARAAGAVVSFDLKLPREDLGPLRRRGARAGSAGAASSQNVDVLVGNEEDLQKGLGIAGPEVARQIEARCQRVLPA